MRRLFVLLPVFAMAPVGCFLTGSPETMRTRDKSMVTSASTVRLFMKETANRTEYIDIDGNGMIDAMVKRTKDYNTPFILVGGEWLEVGDQKGDPFVIGGRVGSGSGASYQGYRFQAPDWVND